jgi:hypothetical protein
MIDLIIFGCQQQQQHEHLEARSNQNQNKMSESTSGTRKFSIIQKGSQAPSSWTLFSVRYLFLCRAKDSGVYVDARRVYVGCLG